MAPALELLRSLEPSTCTWKGEVWTGGCSIRPFCFTSQRGIKRAQRS